jgi:vanillate/3-O-methylgallate O-demethylase
MPGFEFIGDYADAEAVKAAFLEAGRSLGIVQVGGLAYFTGGVESGWVPIPTPGIYTGEELADYRRYVGLFTYEGQAPLHGSFFSEDVEDYYVTPFVLGYGRAVNYEHEFIGRAALRRAQARVTRTKVTLRWDPEDVRRVLGDDLGFFYTHTRDVLERDGRPVGYSLNAAHIADEGTVIGLAFVDVADAEVGTELTLFWGQHPGPGNPPELYRDFERIRAVVVPTPYNAYARNQYRNDAAVA